MRTRKDRLKWSTCWFLVMMILGTTIFIPNTKVNAASKKNKIRITNLSTTTLTLKKGKTKTLEVSKKAKFKSNHPKIVSVNKKGKLTAKKKGKAKITISAKSNKKNKIILTVTVGTPVTKVSAKAKAISIYENGKTTITTKLSPKKPSNKKVIYKSSNKNIATVNAKGQVTGKKAGIVKITVIAADGSEKKATVTIKVKKKPVKVVETKLVSAQVNDYNQLQFQLSTATNLTKDNIEVTSCVNSQMKSSVSHKVKAISTKNKQVFAVTLDERYPITKGYSVLLKVTLPNKKVLSKFMVYKGTPVHLNYSVKSYGQAGTTQHFVDYIGAVGYVSVKMNQCPSGMNAYLNQSDGRFLMSYPNAPAGQHILDYTLTDEFGNTYHYRRIYNIYDSTHIANDLRDEVLVAPANGGTVAMKQDFSIYGGSGSYQYEFDTIAGMSNAHVYFNTMYATFSKVGTYTLKYHITDSNGNKVTDTITVKVLQGVTISGVVKDARGNAISKAKITIYATDQNQYVSNPTYIEAIPVGKEINITTDANGSYSILLPTGSYRAIVYNSYFTETFDLKGIKSNISKTFLVSYEPVTVTCDNINLQEECNWTNKDYELIGEKNTVWLRVGEENMAYCNKQQTSTAKAKLWFTVTPTKNTKTVKASVSIVSLVAYEQYLDNDGKTKKRIKNAFANSDSLKINLTNEYQYYQFKSTENVTYSFTSTMSSNVSNDNNILSILPMTYDENTESTCCTSLGYDNSVSYTFRANHIYYIGVRTSDLMNIGANVIIKRAKVN